MPAQDRLGLDDDQGIFPVLDRAREQDQARTIGGGEARPFDRAVEDDVLLAEQQVFSDQVRFTAGKVSDGAQGRGVGERPGPARERGGDGAQAALNDRLTTIEDGVPDHHLLLHDAHPACGRQSLSQSPIVPALERTMKEEVASVKGGEWQMARQPPNEIC